MKKEVIDKDLEGVNLTKREKAVRDQFVEQYLLDYDYVKATIRTGFSGSFIEQYSDLFKVDVYVQRQITEKSSEALIDNLEDGEVEEQVIKQQVISNLVKEANFKGPGSSHNARVNALAKLAQIAGMESSLPTKIELNNVFNFDCMDKKERDLMRQLLSSMADNATS